MNTPLAAPSLQHPKVLDWPGLLERIATHKQEGKTIVFTNGCFDILHPGHVDLLARAKAQGDILVLGLNSDASVRSLQKGKDRPINPFAQRAFVLAHLEAVNYITAFEQSTPLELITALVPHILIKGGDWTTDAIVGKDIVQRHGGKVLSLPLIAGYSTTDIIQRIRATHP